MDTFGCRCCLFRRDASLHEHLNEASELVRTLKEQAKKDPGQA